MFDLTRFFQSPFDDRNISFSHLLRYTKNHLERLAANDPAGTFAARRAATTTALAAFEATFTVNDGKLGERKAQKRTKQKVRKSLPAAVGKICLAVQVQFGETAPEVRECFPEGRRIFSRCRDAVLENHLETLVAGLTVHAASLPPAVLTQAQSLLAGWRAVNAASGTAGGQKAAAESARRDARRGLERELYLNLLALAQAYPLQPEKLALFAQPSLLLLAKSHPEKSAPSPEA